MNKKEIINEKQNLAEWANSLKGISDHIWFKSFKEEGSWGIADVISHFISWDTFIIENRLNYLLSGGEFPKISVDTEKINGNASAYARSGITSSELIDEFVSIRSKLVELLETIPTEQFSDPFPGVAHITLSDYFTGLIEHDTKHKEQIVAFLNEA